MAPLDVPSFLTTQGLGHTESAHLVSAYRSSDIFDSGITKAARQALLPRQSAYSFPSCVSKLWTLWCLQCIRLTCGSGCVSSAELRKAFERPRADIDQDGAEQHGMHDRNTDCRGIQRQWLASSSQQSHPMSQAMFSSFRRYAGCPAAVKRQLQI